MQVEEIEELLAHPEQLRESISLEFKEATGGLPRDLWETYSAFANTEGGTILLGIREDNDSHEFSPVGVTGTNTLIQDFWDGVRNPQRVSADVLPPRAVLVCHDSEGRDYVAINVPRANRFSLPVRIYVRQRKDFVAYVRRGEADHVASDEELRLFAYDSARDADSHALSDVPLEALNKGTIARYRRVFAARKPEHPWAAEDDLDLLYHLRAIARDASGELHPTRAGLLAFGNEFEIIGTFPYFFLDYREERSDVVRWVDRIHSASGEWSGNTVDFYLDVVNRLDHALPSPFAVERDGWGHTTENDVKDAANEAVANALAHAYYGGSSTVKIVLRPGMLVVTNSGTLVIDRELALAGGTSEPRNPALMRIFSHIGKIDHAGSGLNAIWRTCGRAFGRLPTLEERFLPMPEVELAVPMARAHEHGPTQSQPLGVSLGDESGKRNDAYVRTVASEIGPASEITSEIEMASEITSEIGPASELSPSRESLVLDLLKRNGRAVVSDIAAELGLSAPRTRAILKGMVDEGLVEAIGMNKGRYYVIPSNEGE